MRTRKKTENKLYRNETKEVKCQKLKGEENWREEFEVLLQVKK